MDAIKLFLGVSGKHGFQKHDCVATSPGSQENEDESSKQALARTLVKLFIRQLQEGCSDPACTTQTCYSHRKRVSYTPIRQLSDLSIKAAAFYLAGLPKPYEELCPRISIEGVRHQSAVPREASPAIQTSSGHVFGTKEPSPSLAAPADFSSPRKDPKSFTQALFDTSAIKDFISQPPAGEPEASAHQPLSGKSYLAEPQFIPSLSELRKKFRGDKDFTRSSLVDAYDLLAQKSVLIQFIGECKPLVRAVKVSLEVLAAWINFHHRGTSETHVDDRSQYVDDVAQALEEEPAILLATRLVEIMAVSLTLFNEDGGKAHEAKSGQERDSKSWKSAANENLSRSKPSSAMAMVHLAVKALLVKSDRKLCKALIKDKQPDSIKTTRSWHGPSLLLVLFHVTARLMLCNWDGKGYVDSHSMAGQCLSLLDQLQSISKTWDVRSFIRMHGSANNFQLPEFEMRLDPYEAASIIFNQPYNTMALLMFPWMFSNAGQAKHFRAICFHRMLQSVEDARLICKLIYDGYSWEMTGYRTYPGARAKSLSGGILQSACSRYFTLNTRRKCLLSDAFDQIWRRQEREMLTPLRVNIGNLGEEGLDHGGVAQEFLRGAMAEAFEPSYGCFIVDPKTRMAWFDPKSVEPLHKFELLGLLCAIGVHNGFNLSVNFPLALYKKLLGENVESIADIEDGWPELARGMKQLRDWSEGEVGDIFSCTYVFSFSGYGERLHVDMTNPPFYPERSTKMENESMLAASMSSSSAVAENAPLVTNANRKEYIRDYIQWLVHSSVRPQYEAFQAGFQSLIPGGPGGPLKSVTAPTLRNLVEGQQEINVDELQAGTMYEGYTANSYMVKSFWTIVRRYSQAQLRQLLEFVTASDRIPVTGARGLEFLIQKNGDDSERLPTATTCFCRLLLPDYADSKKLERKLKVALENATGFGLR